MTSLEEALAEISRLRALISAMVNGYSFAAAIMAASVSPPIDISDERQ